MTTDKREAVDLTVDALFTNGSGQRADRLVLTSADGRDLGGWCRSAVADQIRVAAATELRDLRALVAEMAVVLEDVERNTARKLRLCPMCLDFLEIGAHSANCRLAAVLAKVGAR